MNRDSRAIHSIQKERSMGDILSTVRGEYIPPHVKGVDQRRVRGACRLFIRGTGTWGVHWRWLATELEKRAGVPFSAATNVARFASCALRIFWILVAASDLTTCSAQEGVTTGHPTC